MFGIIAAILFGVGFLENGAGGTHNTWTSPTSFMMLGLVFLTVHLIAGAVWPRR